MELRKTVDGRKVTVYVTGTVDNNSSGELNKLLLSLDYTNLDLTLDFRNTEYITSAGLRVLLIARKKLSDDTMRIINVNESIGQVFEMTGFSDIINYSAPFAISEESYNLSFKAQLKKKIDDKVEKNVFFYMGRGYTWYDVDKASQIIAEELYRQGVRKGSHVGICSPNSINWIFTFFAIQKLGGIAVLLNFNLTPEEIVTLSGIADITHLCYGHIHRHTNYDQYSSAILNTPGSTVKHCINISSSVDFTERFDEYDAIKDKFGEMYHADDASVVIYTSGSTGLPKAVLSSSNNLLRCAAPILTEFEYSADDINCAFLPLFHVFGFVSCISAAVLTDMTSCIPSGNSPEKILNVIEKYKCTIFHTVPTMMLMVVQSPEFTPERVASIRCSALGGSAVTEMQMNNLRALLQGNHFANIYGMSENAAISITKYCDSVKHITQTVGTPADGVEIEIRDMSGNKLPRGESGEIWVRSNTMIVCYYKLPIERQPLDDEGWLSTGDLGYIDEDGYIRLVGRVKDLIIRGGENISPNEIASAISVIPSVADVKVLGVPDEIMGEEIAAAIIVRDNETFDEDEVRAFLEERLAKFKMPRYFVQFEKFPILGSGKVDAMGLKKTIMQMLSLE